MSRPADWTPGWIDHPDRHRIALTLPTLIGIAPRLVRQAPAGNILLYKAYKDVLGDYIPYTRQTIGDCVSHGHGHANDLLQCIEAARDGIKLTRAEIETDTEALYGMAREAGNMLGYQDGCYGSAAVKAMTTMGVVPRNLVGPYDGRRAQQWGASGTPAEIQQKAAQWKLGAVAQVTTWEELVAALGAGSPVTICTGMGFTMQRDEQGFCVPQGTWGHCMMICAVRQDGRDGACVFQSWGENVPSGPTTLDQPNNTFWIDRRAAESILAEGDSWALAKAPYFVAAPLPAHWTYDAAA